MPNAFNFSVSPFDCLSEAERRLVRASVDIDYIRPDGVMLQPGDVPTHLFVLIKGHVQQWDGEELAATFGPEDCFDGRALMAGRASSRFVATEEVLAYRLAKATVTELIAANATFGALLFADLSNKLSALTAHERQHELQSLTMARVDQGVLRPARVVSAEADVVSVVRLFAEARISAVLVREPASGPAEDDATTLGIFTTTGLQRAVLSGLPLASTPVRQWTSRPLVTVQASDPLYGALATMIRHRVQRVVVAQDTRVLGMLEQVDLLSALSNHSWLITRQIIEATELDTLAQASAQITKVIGLLHRGGTKVSLIARLVRELNAQLFERTWQLVAPADLVAHSCLFVMGSEGRGEQLLKTDQDNALVLSDGFEPPADLTAICAAFSAALTRFGYPECPGKIMVSNPAWCMPAAAFAEAARGWLLQPSAESLISLAIFMDAQPVAGDATLLAGVQATVRALVNDNDALLARFAASVSAFESSPGWWNRLLAGDEAAAPLDLKKAGTFPLVHGVRSLALAHRIHATSTSERIEALVAADALSREMGTDLQDCLHFFMGLKLKLGLAALDAGQLPDNGVVRERLSSLDRDLLKDTLAVVKRFKLLLRQRFHLDLL